MKIETAAEFLAWEDAQGHYSTWDYTIREMRKKFLYALPKEERYFTRHLSTLRAFEDAEKRIVAEILEGKPDTRKAAEHISPSGRYTLTVTNYPMGEGYWKFSRGVVTNQAGEVVADVKRNYSSFWFTWMEGHCDGHDYLFCGEDYQGQTLCQLDTGATRSEIPDEAIEGNGFCWAAATLLDSTTLLVEGCYWGGPYEYRLYDVSTPMDGWEEIDLEDAEGNPVTMDSGWHSAVTLVDGDICWTAQQEIYLPTGKTVEEMDVQDDFLRSYVPPELLELRDDHHKTFRREGMVARLISEWKSPRLQEREERSTAYWVRVEAENEHFKATDECFLALQRHAAPRISGWQSSRADQTAGYGDRSVLMSVSKDGREFSLFWGILAGPVFLERWLYGKGTTSKEPFPRTPEGVVSAWEAGQAYLKGE